MALALDQSRPYTQNTVGEETMVEFRILGSVEVVSGGAAISVGGPRHRRLLAVLLLHVGRVLSTGKLIDVLWGDAAPRSALAMVHVRVSELRRALRVVGVRLASRDGGYLLLGVQPDQLDAARFERLAAAGLVALADGDAARAGSALEEALALWRGPALNEFAEEPFARSDAARLSELRLQALETRIAADLELSGPHGNLVAELEKLVADHPLRERFWAQLMLALYRADRQGEALHAYRLARRTIRDELGVDPGEALQKLHTAILNGDPALSPGFDGVRMRGRVAPAQLPADVADFTGRAKQLSALEEMLTSNRTVAVLSGTAGVGKTALAVHWAHRIRDRFPDGQLHVDLRGYDPDQPVPATDALARFLTVLGVATPDIPPDLDERAARYRTEIADRRMLVLLDNASSVEQVRPLLPGTAASAVLVTSRNSMPGLVARDGAVRLDLDPLWPEEADALLHRLIGPRVSAEPGSVTALAQRCARLPLALRIAAELANSQPRAALSTLVDELADHERRLELLDAGDDQRTAVTTVFSWSIKHLPPEAARTFRLLGLHPGPDLEAHAVAALAAIDLSTARRTLGTLARAHLIGPTTVGRYGMHDLLRAYAKSLSTMQDTDALDRLFGYYLATSAGAMDTLFPAEAHRRIRVAPADTPVPDLADPDAALGWLDRERHTLVEVAAYTATHGRSATTVQLSVILFRYLDGGHHFCALLIHGHAREAARRAGDALGLARATYHLATVHMRLGRYPVAIEQFRSALPVFREAGDRANEAHTLNSLGIIDWRLGRYATAADQLERALSLFHEVQDRTGAAHALNNLGVIQRRLGRYEYAAAYLCDALGLYRQAGDRTGTARVLTGLGLVQERLGRYRLAVRNLREALALFRELGDRVGEAAALDNLGIVDLASGRPGEAAENFELALALFRGIADRDGEAWALNGLGEAAHAIGDHAAAAAHHTTALAAAIDTGDPSQQARAHTGLGHARRALHDPGEARRHYEQALARYSHIEAPEAGDVRSHLSTLD